VDGDQQIIVQIVELVRSHQVVVLDQQLHGALRMSARTWRR
jgi:hypothetical protein